MSRDLDQLHEANLECDRIRQMLTGKVRHMNDVMSKVKESYAQKKRVVKVNYPQEQWLSYGVQDKR